MLFIIITHSRVNFRAGFVTNLRQTPNPAERRREERVLSFIIIMHSHADFLAGLEVKCDYPEPSEEEKRELKINIGCHCTTAVFSRARPELNHFSSTLLTILVF